MSDCKWKESENPIGYNKNIWHTDCGNKVECFEQGMTPIEFGMEFCCFCGQRLIQDIIIGDNNG